MLMHHSQESYDEAAKRAADHARGKLDALIERGRTRGLTLLEKIERTQPFDLLSPAGELSFEPSASDRAPLRVHVPHDAQGFDVHPFAIGQIVDRAGLPRTYLTRLLAKENAPWGRALLAENLNRLYRQGFVGNDNDDDAGVFLLRTVAPELGAAKQLRGFLSSRFKRIDSRPLVDAFARACGTLGAVPVEGYVTDTKIALKAVLGRVFEPVPNEVMAFGMVLENSDYGNGALSVSFVMLRLWCTNYAIAENSLRRVHLGSRLSAGVSWSPRTLDAETEATASAVHDLVLDRLGPKHVEVLSEGIRRAHEERIEPAAVQAFLKKHLLKSEADAVAEAFASADIENLPAGQTKWRLSNAVSWIAGQTEGVERRLQLGTCQRV